NVGHPPPSPVGVWQGIDGSEVIASVDPGAYTTALREMPSRDEALANRTSELPNEKDLRYYGTGDQGGSPTEESVKFVNDSVGDACGLCETVSAYAGQLADELTDEEKKCLPRTAEELLMITHGVGSYTSVAPTKRFHRSNELKADFAERAAVFASCIGAREYPAKTLEKAWRDFIRHEFHDDLTGTSVQRAYRETFHDDIVVNNTLDGEIGASLCAIAANVDTRVGDGVKLVVFNPTAYERRDAVEARIEEAECGNAAYLSVFDRGGNEVPSQIIARKGGIITLLFRAYVPSQGYAVFRAVPADSPYADAELTVGERELQNARLRVRVDENGDIASVYDKKNGVELLRAPIRLEILENSFRNYGAWEIGYDDLTAAPRKIVSGPAEARVVLSGGCRVSLEVTRVFGASRFTQTLSLDAGGDRLTVYNDINWTEPRSLLKTAFPLDLEAATAVYDAGLGSVERGDRSPEKYEVPVQKWANMYDGARDYSVTILNDCKYGMDKCGNILRLTCIHTPANKFMDETRQDLQDFGQNVYSFAICGGRGDFRKARSERAGTLFNSPPVACVTGTHPGVLPPVCAFFEIDNENVAVRAIKKAEDSDEIVVRVCESAGRKTCASFTFFGGVASAREINGYEQPVGAAKLKNGRVSFGLSPFEPKTFAVRLNPPEGAAEKNEYRQIPIDGNFVFTSRNDRRGEWGVGENRVTVPREIIEKEFKTADIPFSYCEKNGELCCFVPAGEKLRLPEGANMLYLIAARSDGDGEYAVLADGERIPFGVQGFDGDIGGWDQYGSGHFGFIREDRVAFCASHTHDASGDRVYGRFSLFLYALALPEGAREIVLPEDKHMMIAALTAGIGVGKTRLATDIALHKKQKTPRVLDTNGNIGGGTYFSGQPVYIVYGGAGNVVWTRSDGARFNGISAAFDMPDEDVALTAECAPYAKQLPVPCAVIADIAAEGCGSERLLDGRDDTFWRSATDGEATVLLDLGAVRRFSHIVLYHAGSCGQDQTLNTFSYTVEILRGGEWVPLLREDGNILPVTQHDFNEVASRFVRIVIKSPTRNGNDARASLVRVLLFADRDCGDETGQERVTAYDLTESLNKEEVLFDGVCRAGEPVVFPHTAIIAGWRAEGTKRARLTLENADRETVLTDEGFDAVTPDTVARILPQTEADRVIADGFSGEVRLKIYGRSFSLSPIKKYKATECGGTRNNGALRHSNGGMTLRAGEGEGHDLYGFAADVPTGYITLAMKVRISEHELASLPDHAPLFCFDPVFPNGEQRGEDITVGDYKAAVSDADGYRLISAAFLNARAGGCEGRIVNYRSVETDVLDFVFYSGKA
ncbi:MAG: discoidin domain-containing protein, partial [Clostridia bacterium]|nr:discoidin domain-containing protein [Clostridia bacterium]